MNQNEIEAIEARHFPTKTRFEASYVYCYSVWPCDAIRLWAEVVQTREELIASEVEIFLLKNPEQKGKL